MQTNTNGQVMTKFAPISYGSEVLPSAAGGKYQTQITKIVASINKKGSPMLTFDVKTKECLDEQDEANIGQNLKTWVSFAAGAAGNPGRRELKALLKSLELEWDDVVPSTITSLADFAPMIAQLTKVEAPGWVTVEGEGTDDVETRFSFKEPRQRAGSLGAASTDDEEEEDDAPKAKKGTAKKTTRR